MSATYPSPWRGAEAVVLLTLCIAATYGFGMYLFPTMVEAMRRELGFSFTGMGIVSALAQAGLLLCALLGGYLTLRIGAAKTILGAMAACTVALGLMSVVSNLAALGILLAILGGSAGVVWVPAVELSRHLIPVAHQGKAIGLMSSGTAYGLLVNSLLIVRFSGPGDWRLVWVIVSAMTAALCLCILFRLRLPRRRPEADAPATPGIAEAFDRLRSAPKGLTLTIFLMMFLNGLACMPYLTYLSALLQAQAGFTGDAAAMAWRIIGLVGLGGGFALGALADRITVRWAMAITYVLLALSCRLLLGGANGGGLVMVSVAALLFGLAFHAVFGLVPAYITRTFAAGASALVFAAGTVFQGLGGIVGNILGGGLKDKVGSFDPVYGLMFWTAAALVVLSIALPREPVSAPTSRRRHV